MHGLVSLLLPSLYVFSFRYLKCLHLFTCLMYLLYLSDFTYPHFLGAFIFLGAFSFLWVFIFNVPTFYLHAFVFHICLQIFYEDLFLLSAFGFFKYLTCLQFFYMPYVASFFPLKCKIKDGRGTFFYFLFFPTIKKVIRIYFGLLN